MLAALRNMVGVPGARLGRGFRCGADPPPSLLFVERLVKSEFLIEVEALAVAVEG